MSNAMDLTRLDLETQSLISDLLEAFIDQGIYPDPSDLACKIHLDIEEMYDFMFAADKNVLFPITPLTLNAIENLSKSYLAGEKYRNNADIEVKTAQMFAIN